MEVEMNAEAKDKRLNRAVALTVVVLSIAAGLGNIKDGNIVQAMEVAKSNAVDRWGEYQATRIKLHVAETARGDLAVLAATGPAAARAAAVRATALDRDIAKYRAATPGLAEQARGFEAQYDAINVHDDQFDASEALIATAISLSAVSALVESGWLLGIAWLFGACGIFFSVCGFAGWAFHPDILSNFLG